MEKGLSGRREARERVEVGGGEVKCLDGVITDKTSRRGIKREIRNTGRPKGFLDQTEKRKRRKRWCKRGRSMRVRWNEER